MLDSKTVSDCLKITFPADAPHRWGVVRKGEEQGVSIAELSLADLQQIALEFEAGITQVFDFEKCVERRSSAGGTCRSSVLAQISAIEARAKAGSQV